MTHLRDLQTEAWQIAENHGFHEGPSDGVDARERPKILALIHSEVSEALEADRNDEGEDSYAEELADIVIRVLDHAESEGIDLEAEVEQKMAENRSRDYMHGGKEY